MLREIQEKIVNITKKEVKIEMRRKEERWGIEKKEISERMERLEEETRRRGKGEKEERERGNMPIGKSEQDGRKK